MKKIFLSTFATIALTLVACNGSSNSSKAEKEADSSQPVENTETAATGEDEEICDAPYEIIYASLVGSFKVEGTPNIQTFVEALPIFDKEYGWDDDTEIDKANGFFHYSFEGDGACRYYGAVWNRKDGKKLFIFSYRVSTIYEHEGHSKPFCLAGGSKFYYVGADKWDADNIPENEFLDSDVGFAAYLYNPDTKEIESMDEPPFNGWSVSTTYRFLILPQKGKDIEVSENVPGSDESTTHWLRWNGMTFDYEK